MTNPTETKGQTGGSTAGKMYTFEKSKEVFARAVKSIPGGIYGHESPALMVPGEFPYYADRGQGCRYWDVDGNEFIDYMCGYGPMVLGYGHPRVEAAVREQMEKGNCFNHPGAIMVDLAEYLIDLVPIADWSLFLKNGSDATSWSLQVAREYTKRDVILMARGAYHGAHAWCTPGHGGLTKADRVNVDLFDWNNTDSFFKKIEQHKGKLAAVIMTPYHHPAFGDSVLPADGWWQTVEKTCREEGIILIVDDVRAGFRLNLGGSNEYFGFKPDMICYCKAIGNTYPLSACVGREELKGAASKVFATGSFWNSSVPMVAALETLKVLKEENGVDKMLSMGEKLMNGLKDLAKSHGLQIVCSGPPSIPFMRFANESNFLRNQLFCSEVTRRGSFFHPHHNWFMSTAHTEADIEETLGHADAAFKVVKQEFGS